MQKLMEELNRIAELPFEVAENLQIVVIKREVRKHEILLFAGQVASYVYFIESGLVRRYINFGDREFTKSIAGEREFIISDGSFCSREPSKETIEALEASVLYGVRFNLLEAMFRAYPVFYRYHREILVRHTIQNGELLDMHQRSTFLRYVYLMEHERNLAQRVSDRVLASYLGMNKVTFSRQKKRYWHPKRSPR